MQKVGPTHGNSKRRPQFKKHNKLTAVVLVGEIATVVVVVASPPLWDASVVVALKVGGVAGGGVVTRVRLILLVVAVAVPIALPRIRDATAGVAAEVV